MVYIIKIIENKKSLKGGNWNRDEKKMKRKKEQDKKGKDASREKNAEFFAWLKGKMVGSFVFAVGWCCSRGWSMPDTNNETQAKNFGDKARRLQDHRARK
ncbi:hypothetical protein HZH66_002412 [Vespula vulgaris]|uniref:Uncharacterized protein n=1 Tax=Vespula vulgaris TaxID=7454 RepID=A0A834KJN1_VESVU|nr:hypothetical protein HZH66_002412 [Vespula vulgaris]